MTPQEIKSALRERSEEFARWLFPAGRKESHEWKVGSLQGERGKSLSICIEGSKAGVFCDFATDEKGDNFLDLYIQAKQVPFKDALHACADWLGVAITSNAPPLRAERANGAPAAKPFPADDDLLSVDEYRGAWQMITALQENQKLIERIARARGWRVETVQQLTTEPSLGWHSGRLVFIYETGVKLRWRQRDERVIRWAFGKPWIWRGSFLTEAKRVFLCEGETDTISLIDAGVESEPGTLAVGLPSASCFNESWVESFRRKEVILVLDADKAGTDATARVSKLLCGTARSIKRLDWGAVQYASAS